jgi:hypothetical protein
VAGYDPPVSHDELRSPVLDEPFRVALAELDDYLEDVPDERLVGLVLPFASRWMLPEVGLDLQRLRYEADLFVKATPQSDRIVSGYVDHVAYWVSQRMLLDERDEPQPAVAAAQLQAARATLAQRAELVEREGFPRVAAGLRRVLDESSGGEPPDDRLWTAFAVRIAESVLP